MEAIRSSETSVNTTSTRCHISEDCFLHSHRRENLKSYNNGVLLETRYFYVVYEEESFWRKFEQSSEFCTWVCEERTWEHDAEESLLLEAVARERLMKSRQPINFPARGMMICELRRLAMTL
jgi:hypothetical protein